MPLPGSPSWSPPPDDSDDDAPEEEPKAPPVIVAVSEALAARWLPAPISWQPDPEWQQIELPDVPMSPAALSTVVGLVHARLTILLALKLDPVEPEQQARLARIVATLNERSQLLEELAEDPRPWSELAQLNDQVDTIQQAIAAKLFEPDPVQIPLEPWRPLLRQLKPLLPVLAVVEMLKLDVSDPVVALDTLAVSIRRLRKVILPPLAQPHLIMRLIARNQAVKRLEDSLGPVPFEEAKVRVARKLEAVQAQLPANLEVGPDGLLEGFPALSPNPSPVINAPTVNAARQLNKAFVAGLTWNVSIDIELPLLTVGAPVAALVKGGVGPVRSSPCDRDCDAARAAATMWQGSETGAAPAG